jgi:prepilin-type N-terminal cleavage/methylation domain-containing protein
MLIHPRERRRSSQAGFTIMEMLITTSIFLVVMYAFCLIYDVGESNYTTGSR